MKFLIVLVLALASASALNLRSEDILSRDRFMPVVGHEGRIAGGKNADISEVGYQVGLTLQKSLGSGSYWCGGSRIALEWVLTAAHCTEEMNRITVYMGSAQRQNGNKQIVIRHQDCNKNPAKCNIIEHENWNTNTLENDISLIKIEKVPESQNSWIVKLAQSSKNYDQFNGINAIASGWGAIGDSKGSPTYLQHAILTVIPNSLCRKTYGSSVTTGNVCTKTAYGAERRSTCQGDSGGPLVLPADSPKDRIQFGLTSFGAQVGCEKGHPVAFTLVSAFRDWIDKKISN